MYLEIWYPIGRYMIIIPKKKMYVHILYYLHIVLTCFYLYFFFFNDIVLFLRSIAYIAKLDERLTFPSAQLWPTHNLKIKLKGKKIMSKVMIGIKSIINHNVRVKKKNTQKIP